MANSNTEPPLDGDAARILAALTQRQFLRPHRSLSGVLADLEICPIAVEQAMERLAIDGSRSIGRLRAGQLHQLSRTIQRVWEHGQSQASQSPQAV